MQKAIKLPLSFTFKNYLILTKPGIIFGNLVTATAGFTLASRKNLQVSLFLSMLIGLSFVIASACIFNNYIDREQVLQSKSMHKKNRTKYK